MYRCFVVAESNGFADESVLLVLLAPFPRAFGILGLAGGSVRGRFVKVFVSLMTVAPWPALWALTPSLSRAWFVPFLLFLFPCPQCVVWRTGTLSSLKTTVLPMRMPRRLSLWLSTPQDRKLGLFHFSCVSLPFTSCVARLPLPFSLPGPCRR